MKISEKVSKLREILGLNQSEMAQKLGVSRNYVSMIEGGRDPSTAVAMHVEALWEKFGNSTQWNLSAAKGATEFATSAREAFGTGRQLLKRARNANGLSQKELAAAVGYSLAVYQEIEEGRSNMSRKMAEKVAKELGINVDDLLDGCDEPPSNGGQFGTFGETPKIALPPGVKARFVPLLSMAECGPQVAHLDEGYTYEGFLAFNPEDPKAFAVKLSGDSMQPVYGPGDVAVVYPSQQPRNGKVVIARLDDDHGGDVMFKIYQSNRDDVTLSSFNPAFPPITFARTAFVWIYPVDSVTKKI